jgi:hypothetical protein
LGLKKCACSLARVHVQFGIPPKSRIPNSRSGYRLSARTGKSAIESSSTRISGDMRELSSSSYLPAWERRKGVRTLAETFCPAIPFARRQYPAPAVSLPRRRRQYPAGAVSPSAIPRRCGEPSAIPRGRGEPPPSAALRPTIPRARGELGVWSVCYMWTCASGLLRTCG